MRTWRPIWVAYSYNLGGFHRLSGYRFNQLAGNNVLFGRLAGYQRLEYVPPLTRGCSSTTRSKPVIP